jgi:hypothetical protein
MRLAEDRTTWRAIGEAYVSAGLVLCWADDDDDKYVSSSTGNMHEAGEEI